MTYERLGLTPCFACGKVGVIQDMVELDDPDDDDCVVHWCRLCAGKRIAELEARCERLRACVSARIARRAFENEHPNNTTQEWKNLLYAEEWREDELHPGDLDPLTAPAATEGGEA